jgi:diacylglycerol kinase
VTTLQTGWSNALKAVNATYAGFTYDFNDCRAIKKELLVLENYVCFTTNWYVWIIEVLMAITATIMVIMMWVTCYAIKEIDESGNH